MAGGLGIFLGGMWLLTENLKALASRRLRVTVHRWTKSLPSAAAWGAMAGAVTQSMPALTFIVVSVLRAGLVPTSGAFAIIVGGWVGVSMLVLVVTLDIEVIALYVLGAAGAVLISERASGFRPVAASFFGAAMIVLGLALLKNAAAPLAEEPWFAQLVERTDGSLLLGFAVGALLTAIVQSSTAVSVLGIGMATVGVITVDQTLMLIYGTCLGSGTIQYLLSASLVGRSRQVAMYQVGLTVLACLVLVPMFYVERSFDIPLVKALVLSLDLGLAQQLALVFIVISLVLVVIMLAIMGPTVRWCERLWPPIHEEELSTPKFIHDRALSDGETSLTLADLEQRRVLAHLSRYFDTVREGTVLEPVRAATGQLLAGIEDFLAAIGEHHPMYGVEGGSSIATRQKLIRWLEEQVGALCEVLKELPDATSRAATLRTSICEGVDAVLLSMVHALETGDEEMWTYTRALAGDRSDLMRRLRNEFWNTGRPSDAPQRSHVVIATSSVEHILFLISKLVQEYDASGTPPRPAPVLASRDLVS